MTIPNEWIWSNPTSLVVGDGAYASGLSAVLASTTVRMDQLFARSGEDQSIMVLQSLSRVLLIVSSNMSPSEALLCHAAVWDWVEQLSVGKDQHDMAFLFVLPHDAPACFEDTLALGMGTPVLDPVTTGHAVWRRSEPIVKLLDLISRICPKDLLVLRSRRESDPRYAAMDRLCAAVAGNSESAARSAAQEVRDAFPEDKPYLLDSCFRPPAHHIHGQRLREWLRGGVTSSVTPAWWTAGRGPIASMLRSERLNENTHPNTDQRR